MVDPFTSPTLEDKEVDFHAIVTNHPYMKALGLNVFTTGNLYNWLNKRDGDGNYANRKLVNNVTMNTILGGDYADTENWGGWYGWRKSGATGSYKHQTHSSWTWTTDFLDTEYKKGDLTDFTTANPLFDGIFDSVVAQGESIADEDGKGLWDVVYLDLPTKSTDLLNQARDFLVFDAGSNPIIDIIQRNRYMNSFKRSFPRKDWHKVDNRLELFANDQFLNDIKSSKYDCVEFSGLVPFNINLADSKITCIKKEWVSYKLYLYDDARTRSTERVAIMKDFKFGGHKRDEFGRAYKDVVDGETVDADITNPSEQAVGEIDRSWNPVTKKWEAGTPNMMAKVVGRIGAAVNNPTVESLIDSNIGADLDADETRHFAPSSGLVMPIHPQNGNPMQWQPKYAQSSGCRGQGGVDDTAARRKQQVVAFNYNPLKAYDSDTLVMISKIGGVWHITDMGSGIALDAPSVAAGIDGKWSFQYLATNSVSFFNIRTENGTFSKTTPEFIESSFHHLYYREDPLNSGDGLSSGIVYNDYFSSKGSKPFTGFNGWWQFSSFDFMDKLICGTRDKNALGTTNAAEDAGGVPIPNSQTRDAGSNSRHSGPFFGCVFPDGYSQSRSDLSRYFAERAWFINKASSYNNPHMHLTFDTSIQTPATLPFTDTITDFVGGEGPGVGEEQAYKADRADNRASTIKKDPEQPFENDEDIPQRWSPVNGPSMFHRSTKHGDISLKQLPADIATLASFSGNHGCPIHDVHSMDVLYIGNHTKENCRDAAARACGDYSWLRKDDGLDLENTKFNKFDSAFDFKPKSAGKIQFRPLKHEVYAQYYPWTKADHDDGRMGDHDGSRYAGVRPDGGRALYSAEAARAMISATNVTSNASTLRNIEALNNPQNVAGFTQGDIDKHIYTAERGLAYSNDIIGNDGQEPPNYINNWITPNNKEVFFPGYGGRMHSDYFWAGTDANDYAKPWMDNQNGGNAYGVIGAVTTVTANDQINFVTNNNFGMWDATFITSNAFFTYGYKIPAWGGTGRSYKTNRTTDLWVKVYHAWPREQTLYDTRYFAVHHFNPEPGLQNAQPGVSGAKFPKAAGGFRVINVDTRSVLPLNWHGLGQGQKVFDPKIIGGGLSEISVDKREPASFPPGDEDNLEPVPLDTGTVVWSNSNNQNELKVMPKEYWNINYDRVGKLLPYNYRYKTLSGPWASGLEVDLIGGNRVLYSGVIPEDGVPAADASLRNTMIIRNWGSGYSVGDIIGNSAADIAYSVIETGVNPITKEEGAVTKLKVFQAGRDMSPSQAFASGELVRTSSAGGLAITNINSAGKRFSGYFVHSKVDYAYGVDHKPNIVAGPGGTITQISKEADKTAKDTTHPFVEDFGFVYGTKTSNVTISAENKSDSRQYDLFFFFHNDTSHTFNSNFMAYDRQGNQHDCDEQWIELQISSI